MEEKKNIFFFLKKIYLGYKNFLNQHFYFEYTNWKFSVTGFFWKTNLDN